ncbi:hypothetical protein TRVL_06841 [Trypanosoma vivax]|nr:hypothetical protein TRVL_06841 [Trypanosoma vivax]
MKCAGAASPLPPSEVLCDLEAFLTRLRNESQRQFENGLPKRRHPSVAFYAGECPVRLLIPPKEAPTFPPDGGLFHVISLHQALLPVCHSATFSDEEQSLRLSSPTGLELLRLNWELLLYLLFPSVQPDCLGGGIPSGAKGHEDGETVSANSKEGMGGTCSIFSVHDVCFPLSWDDYSELRQPCLMDRVHYSYVVFLRFFGWRIHDEESGVLDLHRSWRLRYAALSRQDYFCSGHTASGDKDAVEGNGCVIYSTLMNKCANECSPRGGTGCGFEGRMPRHYYALTHILNVLLELCLIRYAVNLIAFLMEEMTKGRLLFLQPLLEEQWLPLVFNARQVPDADKARLRHQLYRLTHSDSD